MKKIFLSVLTTFLFLTATAQLSVTNLAGDYKVINIGNNVYGDYTRALVLLHEMYNGTNINFNYAVGTITATRGTSSSGNRINVASINTSSSYQSASGMINSYNDYALWSLKTCMYNGKKYLAVEVPYSDAYHDHGYYFTGWTSSTGENMKCVPYLVNGSPVNQALLSNIQNFNSDMTETHAVAALNITGTVGIGTTAPDAKLTVNGSIHSKEVKVDLNVPGPDYVFKPDYKLVNLNEVKNYIDENHHLPEIPSADQMAKEGINLGEMNMRLLKKVEELTLYLIDQQKINESLQDQIKRFTKRK